MFIVIFGRGIRRKFTQ